VCREAILGRLQHYLMHSCASTVSASRELTCFHASPVHGQRPLLWAVDYMLLMRPLACGVFIPARPGAAWLGDSTPGLDELLVTVLAPYCLLPPAAVSLAVGTIVLAWVFYVPSKFELLLCAFRLHVRCRMLLAGRPLKGISRFGLSFLYAPRRPIYQAWASVLMLLACCLHVCMSCMMLGVAILPATGSAQSAHSCICVDFVPYLCRACSVQ
jgi:hypothetical protein